MLQKTHLTSFFLQNLWCQIVWQLKILQKFSVQVVDPRPFFLCFPWEEGWYQSFFKIDVIKTSHHVTRSGRPLWCVWLVMPKIDRLYHLDSTSHFFCGSCRKPPKSVRSLYYSWWESGDFQWIFGQTSHDVPRLYRVIHSKMVSVYTPGSKLT